MPDAPAPAPPRRGLDRPVKHPPPDHPAAPATGRGPRRHTISVKLRELNQFFNSMDPSPFVEKGLDTDAEDFIVEAARAVPAETRLNLHLILEDWPATDPTPVVQSALRAHFVRRAQATKLELGRLMRQGRTSVLIGLVFLSGCLVISRTVFGGSDGTWTGVARESLTIAGWVAMWRPMQIYLYDWWPLRRRIRAFLRLSHMTVTVSPAHKAVPAP